MKIKFQVEYKHEMLKIEPKGRKACSDSQILLNHSEEWFCSNARPPCTLLRNCPCSAFISVCSYQIQSPVVVELTTESRANISITATNEHISKCELAIKPENV